MASIARSILDAVDDLVEVLEGTEFHDKECVNIKIKKHVKDSNKSWKDEATGRVRSTYVVFESQSSRQIRKPPPLTRQSSTFYDLDEDATSSGESSSDEDDNDGEKNKCPPVNRHLSGVPFNIIHYFKTDIEEFFLPHIPVEVAIVEVLHQPAYRINPNLYKIEVRHGGHTWSVRHRYKAFLQLHKELLLYRAKRSVMRPMRGQVRFKPVPSLPVRPDVGVNSEKAIKKRSAKLIKFLRKVVQDNEYRNCKCTAAFLEVSAVSFVKDLGQKSREGMIAKRAGGHKFAKGVLNAMKIYKVNIWHERWLVLRESFLLYMDLGTNRIRDVLLIDSQFTVKCGRRDTGVQHGLLVRNDTRNLKLKCRTFRMARDWFRDIVKMMAGKGSDFWKEHRYNSFAPRRQNQCVKWFIDGSDYFCAVAEAICRAQEEIFITDWWLSPELHLKRPVGHVNEWRLDLLLKERADAGVRIYVLLYKEIELALPTNSNHTKRTLLDLNMENIMVLRHPDHISASTGVLKWAHHEKILCIDQKIAFLGGLDLCFGRWDDVSHRLADVRSAKSDFLNPMARTLARLSGRMLGLLNEAEKVISSAFHLEQLRTASQASENEEAKFFPGKDYCNFYVKDVDDVTKPFEDHIDRQHVHRMPWHDIACVTTGAAARDVARHFIQRWNFTKHEKAREEQPIPFLLPKAYSAIKAELLPPCIADVGPGLPCQCDIQILRSCALWSCGAKTTDSSICEAYIEKIKNAKYYIYIENQFFITSLPNIVFNRIGNALVDRIVTAAQKKEKFKVYVVMPLLPSFPGEIGESSNNCLLIVEHFNLQSICRSRHSIISSLISRGVENPHDFITFNGLRTHSEFAGRLVTEIVYVHSKLLIVDDLVAIIGSANINDRSMLGSRDSEIAILVEDTLTVEGMMDGRSVKVGLFASSLRKRLFQEHLGLLNEPAANVMDPLSDAFFKGSWQGLAEANALIYEQVFRCLPTNEVKTFAELAAYKAQPGLADTDPVEARRLLQGVRGYLVTKPLNFLENQNMIPSSLTKEGMVSTDVWT